MDVQAKTDGSSVVMVDAEAHPREAEEQEQIAFADVVLLNKTDLVTSRS